MNANRLNTSSTPIILFFISGLGTLFSFFNLADFLVFNVGILEPSMPIHVYNFYHILSVYAAKLLFFSANQIYLVLIVLTITLPVVMLLINIKQNNLKSDSIFLLLLNLIFSLPIIYLLFFL
ncbi:hypothetical protein EM4838_04230 [Enterococcus mundtii]|uniref:Uncharacterized protein n=1 Tax=Enterococcus mundtii TaxID=53346 RepID=A0A242L296_ENTMU|nr:hypothetical protein EM4838_04230 [Enterococcus mundtii]OTP28241.1 hypothetical protein A5802_001980 [Enterococcus mundtii]QCJ57196.1 hypothetical protein DDJ96_11485 [Enterococcus mundtii]RYT06909.1 hypothetical protein EAI87_00165 [Enterococcus mundtii]